MVTKKSYLLVRAVDPGSLPGLLKHCYRIVGGFQSQSLRFVETRDGLGDGAFEYDGSACGLAPVLAAFIELALTPSVAFGLDDTCPNCGFVDRCPEFDTALLDRCQPWIRELIDGAVAPAGGA